MMCSIRLTCRYKIVTPDSIVTQISVREERVVITKDADFVDSFNLHGEPYKLLLIATGNIKNSDLLELFTNSLEQIIEGFAAYSFIELDRFHLIFHR